MLVRLDSSVHGINGLFTELSFFLMPTIIVFILYQKENIYIYYVLGKSFVDVLLSPNPDAENEIRTHTEADPG